METPDGRVLVTPVIAMMEMQARGVDNGDIDEQFVKNLINGTPTINEVTAESLNEVAGGGKKQVYYEDRNGKRKAITERQAIKELQRRRSQRFLYRESLQS